MAPTIRESETVEETLVTSEKEVRSDGEALSRRGGSYRVPIVGAKLPERLVERGFWVALTAVALTGAVDPPLAVLLGAGVVVARHRRPGG